MIETIAGQRISMVSGMIPIISPSKPYLTCNCVEYTNISSTSRESVPRGALLVTESCDSVRVSTNEIREATV